MSYCLIFGQLVSQMFRQCCVQHANGWTLVHPLVYAVSNTPIAGELSVQQSNGHTVIFPTVQWSDSPVSNCPKVKYFSVQLYNGGTVQCPTLQWLVNPVSNCLMAGQLRVQLSNGLTVFCQTVQWSNCALSKSEIMLCQTVQWLDIAVSNSLIILGCINIFAKFRLFCQTVWDSKSYSIGQFQIFCTPESDSTLYTAYCTLHVHTAHNTLHTAHCTQHTSHCTLQTAHGIFLLLPQLLVDWPASGASRLGQGKNSLICHRTAPAVLWGILLWSNKVITLAAEVE